MENSHMVERRQLFIKRPSTQMNHEDIKFNVNGFEGRRHG